MTKPFSFGVNVRSATSAGQWAAKARRIEDLGYSTLTVPDHLAEMLAPNPAALGTAAARVARLAEAVTIVKALLRGERVTFAGRDYLITDHAIYPKPVQVPHPPILIGGNGPRLLELAAREVDIVGLTGITFAAGGTQPDLSAWRSRAAAGARFQRLVLEALVQRVVITKPTSAGPRPQR